MKKESIIKAISALEENYKASSSYCLIEDITSSKEVADYIEKDRTIFFPASKSRIVLVHWMCEEIRKMFEEANFEPINMSNEVYETLRKCFKTKAFNKTEYLQIFHAEKNNILSFQDFEKLEAEYIDSYNAVVPNEMQLPTINHVFMIKKDEKVNLKSEITELFKKERQEDVLYKRASGKTLDAIGIEFKITRERARQIEIKPKALIERWMENRHEEIIKLSGGCVLADQNVLKNYFGERYWTILKYTANEHKGKFTNWSYIKELDTICYSKDFYKDVYEILKHNAENRLSVEDTLKEIRAKGYTFFDIEDLQKFCQKGIYHIYDGILFDKKLNIGKSILVAAETAFKDGIDIQTQLPEFADYLNKEFNLNVKADRALTARIQDTLIMSGKTVYKSPKFIGSSKDLNQYIKDYMKTVSDDRVTYKLLYEAMPKDVLEQNDINSQAVLHGYVKNNEEALGLVALRYYACKNDTDEFLSKGFFQSLADWMVEIKRPVTLKEITDHFPGWTNMYPKYAMLYFPQISQWKKGTYINLELIKMTDSVKETAERVLDECLDNDKNYTNAYIVYKKLIALEPEFFKKNKIENENHLYHVLKYYLGGTNKYLFTKPHILSVRAGVSDYKTEDLIFAVLGDREIFSKQELLVEVMKYYGIKNSSLALAMQKVLKSYVRVDGSRYYSRKKLKMSNKAIEKMDDFIEKNLIDGKYLVADKIYDFSGLPKMPFEWTSWSLCEVAKIYSKKFTVLSKKNNVMQNTMAIVPNGTFKTKEELAVYLVKNDYHGEDNEEEIVKYMKSLGLFSQGFSFSAIKEMLQS